MTTWSELGAVGCFVLSSLCLILGRERLSKLLHYLTEDAYRVSLDNDDVHKKYQNRQQKRQRNVHKKYQKRQTNRPTSPRGTSYSHDFQNSLDLIMVDRNVDKSQWKRLSREEIATLLLEDELYPRHTWIWQHEPGHYKGANCALCFSPLPAMAIFLTHHYLCVKCSMESQVAFAHTRYLLLSELVGRTLIQRRHHISLPPSLVDVQFLIAHYILRLCLGNPCPCDLHFIDETLIPRPHPYWYLCGGGVILFQSTTDDCVS